MSHPSGELDDADLVAQTRSSYVALQNACALFGNRSLRRIPHNCDRFTSDAVDPLPSRERNYWIVRRDIPRANAHPRPNRYIDPHSEPRYSSCSRIS